MTPLSISPHTWQRVCQTCIKWFAHCDIYIYIISLMKESLDLLDFELVVWHLSYYVCSRSGPGFISLSPQENHGCFKTWTLAPKHQFSPPINHYVPRARCDPSRGSSGSAAKPMTEQSANGLQLVQQKCTNQVCWAKTKLHFQFCMRCMILLVPHQFFTLEKKMTLWLLAWNSFRVGGHSANDAHSATAIAKLWSLSASSPETINWKKMILRTNKFFVGEMQYSATRHSQ